MPTVTSQQFIGCGWAHGARYVVRELWFFNVPQLPGNVNKLPSVGNFGPGSEVGVIAFQSIVQEPFVWFWGFFLGGSVLHELQVNWRGLEALAGALSVDP